MDEFDVAAHHLAQLCLGRWTLLNDMTETNALSKFKALDKGNEELREAMVYYARLLDENTTEEEAKS